MFISWHFAGRFSSRMGKYLKATDRPYFGHRISFCRPKAIVLRRIESVYHPPRLLLSVLGSPKPKLPRITHWWQFYEKTLDHFLRAVEANKTHALAHTWRDVHEPPFMAPLWILLGSPGTEEGLQFVSVFLLLGKRYTDMGLVDTANMVCWCTIYTPSYSEFIKFS